MRPDMMMSLVTAELKRHARNPVWMIGATAMALLTFTEGSSMFVSGPPTANGALEAFQLGTSMLLGITVFLLAATSLSQDLAGTRRDLLLVRGVPSLTYALGKYLGAVLFGLAIALLMAIASVLRPIATPLALYPLSPFVKILAVAILPMLLFTSALALLFTTVTRRLIVAFPIYLVLFFALALFRAPDLMRAPSGSVDLFDISMRLYPDSIRFPLLQGILTDASFGRLLDPLAAAVILRALVYTLLAAALFAGAASVLPRIRRTS
ncbi:MAG: hypothetical protein AB1486_27370 [Planctomycetota bacterium]